jgi:starch phosphorylase
LALGDGREHGDDPAWYAVEADRLYHLLEQDIVPEFYTRDPSGIPTTWVARMRESMARLTPRFSADRAVREYTQQYYLPGAAAYLARAVEKGVKGAEEMNWKHSIEQKWNTLHFGEVKVNPNNEHLLFEVQLYLGDLEPGTVRVEIYANGVNGEGSIRQEMQQVRQLAGVVNGYEYSASVPAIRPAGEYTARVIPYHEGMGVPLEATQILWER